MKAKTPSPALGGLRGHRWLLLLAVCAGCSSKGTVSGRVTYQGKPVPAGTVIFVPHSGGGGFSAGIRNGEYKIGGLPEGLAKISVSTLANTAPMKGMIGKMKPPPEIQEKLGRRAPAEGPSSSPNDAPQVLIPARFQDPEKSGLTCTVKTGSQVHDIDIPDK